MKRFNGIQKLTDNRFLNMYHLDALDTNGKPFDYYFVSRNSEDKLKLTTGKDTPEGIVIYAVTKELHPRLVLIREYRYPLNDYIYAMPAGLIDGNETPGQAAVREMGEETNLNFTEYTGGAGLFRRPFFMGPGFTDETSCAVYGTVDGTLAGMNCENTEDIQVILADKNKVKEILESEKVSLRGAYLMMHYLKMRDDAPFDFLEV